VRIPLRSTHAAAAGAVIARYSDGQVRAAQDGGYCRRSEPPDGAYCGLNG